MLPHLRLYVVAMIDIRVFNQHKYFLLPTIIEGTRPVIVVHNRDFGTNANLEAMIQDPVYVVVILPVMEEDRIKTSDRLHPSAFLADMMDSR